MLGSNALPLNQVPHVTNHQTLATTWFITNGNGHAQLPVRGSLLNAFQVNQVGNHGISSWGWVKRFGGCVAFWGNKLPVCVIGSFQLTLCELEAAHLAKLLPFGYGRGTITTKSRGHSQGLCVAHIARLRFNDHSVLILGVTTHDSRDSNIYEVWHGFIEGD